MLKKILGVFILVVIVMSSTVAYIYLKPTEAASAPIAAIPLVINSSATQVVASTDTTPTSIATDESATTVESSNEAATTEVVNGEVANAEATAATNGATGSAASSAVLFQIVPEESQASFIIDEVLNGSPKTVVGTTDQVAGQLAVDTQNVDNTQIGVIQINARTLTTDSDMRNRAISNRILYTDDYEYITFTPTAISGLPEKVEVGDQISFQVTGNLTIRDVTQPVTFDMQVTVAADNRLEGTATTTVNYANFGISIPNVPAVTGVSDTVSLQLDFAATPV